MKAYQLIQSISPELAQGIIDYIQAETREAFRTALYQIGSQKKLRPQYFHSKSRQQQGQWLLDHLKVKTYDGVTEQILQLWLLKGKTGMLTAFLDATNIEHDGNGQVDELPEELSAESVAAGIDAMLKDNRPEEVLVYLHLFQQQRPDGWKAITEALEQRPEFQTGSTASA